MKIYYKPEIETVQSEGLLVVDKDKVYYGYDLFMRVESYRIVKKKGLRIKGKELEDFIEKEYQAVYVGEI